MRQLINLLSNGDNEQSVRLVAERIEVLLQEYDLVGDMPVDESIAAYLYCLWKVDTGIALTASNKILEAGGQWWSVQLALHIIKATETEVV